MIFPLLFSALKEVLCEEYKYRASRFHPLPWIDKILFKLEDVFTKLSIVKRRTYGWEKTDQIVEPSDMFDEDKESMSKPRIILIEGSPGTGKTTLSLKLAYDWAMGHMPNKFPEVELFLLIKCRDMKDSIQESAKTQLLPWDNDELRNVLDSFLHSGKIMLIVDGMDEISKSAESHVVNLLQRKILQNCYVVLTSRQEKGMEVRKYCDKLLEIEGYSYKSIKSYINKYFGSNIDLAKKLRKKVRPKTENDLQTLVTNPLNTLLLCVVFEDNGGNLPTTVTELYQNIVECIWKRYCKKKRPDEKDISFEIAMQTLGRLAYESLIEHDTLYFRESELREDEIQCTNIDFLYKDDISTKILKPDNTYWFLHKTFQEYFAAYHCVYIETESDMSKLSHYTSDGVAKFIQVLKLMSSMLQKKSAKDHVEFIKKLGSYISSQPVMNKHQAVSSVLCTVLSENDLDKDIAGTVKTFIAKNLTFNVRSRDPYNRYLLKIMPRILNLLGTEVKGVDNQKVELDNLGFFFVSNGTEWLKLICEALMKNLVVDTIDLHSCIFKVNYLAKMLSENSTVRVLHLPNNLITNEEVDILAKGLCKNSTLKKLNIFKNDLGFHNECPSKFTGMAEMLARNDKLEELSLSRNPLGSAGVTWIAEALESNKGVKHLNLKETDCGDEGAAALAKMLGINRTLEFLYLCGRLTYDNNDFLFANNIGDDGATALADVLKEHNSSLRELHLCRNKNITGKGLRKLTETVQKNKTLTLYIDVHEQVVTVDEETMVRIKPGCDGYRSFRRCEIH